MTSVTVCSMCSIVSLRSAWCGDGFDSAFTCEWCAVSTWQLLWSPLPILLFRWCLCKKKKKHTKTFMSLTFSECYDACFMLTGCWPLFSILNWQILKRYLSSHVTRKSEKGISQNVRLKEIHSLWDEFPCCINIRTLCCCIVLCI